MKKFLLTLGLGAIFGIGALSAAVLPEKEASKAPVEVAAVDLHDLTNDKFIPMTASNLVSDQFDVGAQIRGNNPNFWSGRYYGTSEDVLDTVDINGGQIGEIRTHYFNQQGGKYITFLMGGNTDDCFINIFVDGKGDVGDHLRNPFFSDPYSSLNMCFRYFHMDNADAVNRTLIFFRDDNAGSNCGGITFSELRINQTYEEVVESYRNFLLGYKLSASSSAANKSAYDRIMELHNNDAYYAGLKASLDAQPALTNVNDNFEVNNSLKDWVVDWQYTTNHFNKETIYSNATHKQDGYFVNGMPFNQQGSYFLNEDANGFPEGGKFRLVSRAFTLDGVGLISAKLGGGTAVLQLLDADTLEVLASTDIHGDAEGEYVCNPGFNVGTGDRADLDMYNTGARLNTLTRVYLDCYAHKNKSVRVALTDGRSGGGWGKAYFDDVVTYYASYPYFNVEAPLSQKVGGVDHYGVVTDRYVGDTSTLNFGKAYSFVRRFWDEVRGLGNQQSWCSATVDPKVTHAGLIEAYDALGEEKAIVDGSADFCFVSGGNRTAYLTSPVNVEDYNVGDTMLALENFVFVNNQSSRGVIGLTSDSSTTTIIIISVVCLASAVALFVFLRKRKVHAK